jgi:hypothetical protein
VKGYLGRYYLQRKVQQEKCDKTSAVEKSWQKNHGRKSVAEKSRQKKCARKIVVEKSPQKKCAKKLRQQHGWGLFMRDMENLV